MPKGRFTEAERAQQRARILAGVRARQATLRAKKAEHDTRVALVREFLRFTVMTTDNSLPGTKQEAANKAARIAQATFEELHPTQFTGELMA